MLIDTVKFNTIQIQILCSSYPLQYTVTPIMTFINALIKIKTVTVLVNSLKGSVVAAKCQCLWGNCALHKILPTYYAGIMLDAFAILLCSKLCWHNWLKR